MFYYRISTKLRLSAEMQLPIAGTHLFFFNKEFFALMEYKDFIKPVHINS